VANTVENGLKMLVHNHVDVFVSNRRNTDPVIARLGYGRQVKPLPRVKRRTAISPFPFASLRQAAPAVRPGTE
jgi:hypothetical protein